MAEDFFDFQINRNLTAAESKTTAGRVAFARKMSQFIGVVPDPVLRDTLISRLAARLTIPRDTLQQMVRSPATHSQGRSLDRRSCSDTPVPIPRHDLAVICKAALVVPDLLNKIKQQPWKSVLKHVEGAELLSKIFESELQPNEPASIAAFFASLPNSEARDVNSHSCQQRAKRTNGRRVLGAIGRRRTSAQETAAGECSPARRRMIRWRTSRRSTNSKKSLT